MANEQPEKEITEKMKELMAESEKLTEYSMEEIAKHNKEGDLWIVVGNRVLDVSKFEDHPGGPDVLEGVGGEDATEEFDQIAHSNAAKKQVGDWLKGRITGTTITDLFDAGEGDNTESSIVFTVVAIIIAVAAYYYLK